MGFTLQLHRDDLGPVPIAAADFGDDFTGPDGTILDGDRVPPKTQPGIDYAVSRTQPWSGYPRILNGRATSGDMSGGFCWLTLNTGRTDYDVIATVTTPPESSTTATNALTVCNSTDARRFHMGFRKGTNEMGYVFSETIANDTVILAESTRLPAAGDVLWVERRGRLFRGYVNGELILQATSGQDHGSFAGLRFGAGDVSAFDDLCIYFR